jgi:hypothetical protein
MSDGTGGGTGGGTGTGTGTGGVSGNGSYGTGLGLGPADDFHYLDHQYGGASEVKVSDSGSTVTDATYALASNPNEYFTASANFSSSNNDTLQEITVSSTPINGGLIFNFLGSGDTASYNGPAGNFTKKGTTGSMPTGVSTKIAGTPGTAAYYKNCPPNLNPSTVKVNATGNTVTLYFFPDDAHGFGHLAFSINGSVAIGWGAAAGQSLTSIGLGEDVPGYATLGNNNESADEPTGPVTSVTFTVSQSSALSLQATAAAAENVSSQGSGQYEMYGANGVNNCSTWVGNALQTAAIGSSVSIDPSAEFMNALNWEFAHNASGVSTINQYK